MAVILVASSTYIMTLGYDFAFDDHNVIAVGWQFGAENPLEVLQTPVRADNTNLPYFRPLITLSYWLDGVLWQGNPGGYHLTNLLLHALVSVLVLHVARRFLPVGPTPVLAGLLFAVHPIHVEAVAWVQGRVDLLSAAGVLLAILLALAGVEAAEGRRPLYWVGSAIAFFLALLAKEVAAVTPLLTAVVLATKLSREDLRRLRMCLPLFALQGVIFLLYLAVRTAALTSPALGLFGGPSFGDRILLMLRVVPTYLRLLIWPAGLNPKHFILPPTSVLEGEVLMGAVLLAVLGVAASIWRRVPGLGPGLAWLGLAWLPVSNVIPIPAFVLAERYLYLPSVGFCIALAGTVAHAMTLGERWRRSLVPATAAMLLTLATLSVAQASTWRDPLTFYENLVRLNPDSALAHNGVGAIYLDRGEEQRAEREFREALRLQPGHAAALNNLGILAQRRGDLVEARRLYREALVARPNQADVWNNLGTLYEAEGDLARATVAYGEAVRLDPAVPRFMANLAGVLAAQGKRKEAVGLLERAIMLNPSVPRWRAALAALQTDGNP
jgi:Flp pilus assembly protein TadD